MNLTHDMLLVGCVSEKDYLSRMHFSTFYKFLITDKRAKDSVCYIFLVLMTGVCAECASFLFCTKQAK